jgi:aryl-alcohol dehydrogenase-like predicted oxidoreductase
MERRRLGRSGMTVSSVALGTMSWGHETDDDDAAQQLHDYVEAGGNFVDTADVYGGGESERVLGRLLNSVVPRDDLVIATKAALQFGTPDGRRCNASRHHLLGALDRSLQRLGVDHVDLWQVHNWDEQTPLDETLGALDAAVASGKVRYVGISNYNGWQTAKAATWQRADPSRASLVSTQMEYSLLSRGIEREVVPAAVDLGLGILPWSPLGRGVLTGKYRGGTPTDSRAASARYERFVTAYLDDRADGIVGAVMTAADGLGVAPLAIALAWVRDRRGVVAPIVGARTAGQLQGSLSAADLALPEEIRKALDEVSTPHFSYPDRNPLD